MKTINKEIPQTVYFYLCLATALLLASCSSRENPNEPPVFVNRDSLQAIFVDLEKNPRGVTKDDLVDAIKILTKGGVVIEPSDLPLIKKESPYWEEKLKGGNAISMVSKAKLDLSLMEYFRRHSAYFDTPLKSACGWFEERAKAGEIYAMHEMAKWYATGRVCVAKEDAAKASELFLIVAQYGYVDAQRTMGYRFKDGIGVKKDNKESLFWFSKAAAQGDMDSKIMIGNITNAEILLDIGKRLRK